MPEYEYESLDYDAIEATTVDAVLIVIDEKPHWVPRSVIEGGHDVEVTDESGTLQVAEWFLVKEGLG